MNFRRMLKMLVTFPNSSEGLIIRAEMSEEKAEKEKDTERAERMFLYAKVLRELASKNLTTGENKEFIKKHLREGDKDDQLD